MFFFFFPCQKDPDALLDPEEKVPIPREEAAKRACAAFEAVFANGHQVELDHYIVYNARKQPFTSNVSYLRTLLLFGLTRLPCRYRIDFEYGRLLACMGDKDGARSQLDLVLSGKPLEVNAAGRKVRSFTTKIIK